MKNVVSKVQFASPHCLIDCASGAAVATMDALELLARNGFSSAAFCASKVDGAEGSGVGVQGSGRGLDEIRNGLVPITLFRTESTRIDEWAPGEPQGVLAAFERALENFRPDVMLTYGGHPVARQMMSFAKRRGIPIVFGLHNFAYDDASVFRDVDHVIVPSEFSRAWYRERLGIECQVMSYVVDPERVRVQGSGFGVQQQAEEVESGKSRAESRNAPHPNPLPQSGERESLSEPRTLNPENSAFVTFVNPQPTKGVFVFARIAEQLQRRRPEIPILVVESRGQASWLEQTNLDLSWAENLHAMANTPDPRDFYAVTKLLLVPSLWNESFGLVAAEAMTNGIPVLASDRGALPEVVEGRGLRVEGRGPEGTGGQRSEVRGQMSASGGFLFEIPERYTPETTAVPTVEEVEPWVETVIRLWDDDKLYRECSEKVRAHAQQWHPNRLGPMYAEFFRAASVQGSGFRVQKETKGRQLSVVSGQLSESAPQPSTLNSQPFFHPQLSLCLIARDNERTIRAALEGIRPWVDEMVVVDTGSKDATPQIAAELGARVFHFPWCDDFSAARNESIRHARGQWIFWMDTDDTIDAENGRKLRELVSGQLADVARNSPHPNPLPGGARESGPQPSTLNPQPSPVLGFLMKVRCPTAGGNGDVDFVEVDQVKLFRNLPELRFEGRIHEQVLMSIRRAGGAAAWTDIFVVHANADQSPEGRARKLDRDLRILELDHRERPDHPFALFNLGMTLAEAGRHEEAIGFLWQSIGRSGPDESHLRKTYALLVSSYRRLGRHEPALETSVKGLKCFPDDPELRFRHAALLQHFGRLTESARAYEDLLVLQNGRHLSSVDRGLKGYRARHNLAAVYAQLGELAKAETLFRQAIDESPAFRPAWTALGDVLLRQTKAGEALEIADRMQTSDALRIEQKQTKVTKEEFAERMQTSAEFARDARILRSDALASRGETAQARGELDAAIEEHPGDLELLERRCRLLFEHFPPAEAEGAFHDLLSRDPENAAAHHNVGSILYKLGRYDDSAAAYRRSLELRPDSAPTRLHLGYALREAGNPEDASTAFQEAGIATTEIGK